MRRSSRDLGDPARDLWTEELGSPKIELIRTCCWPREEVIVTRPKDIWDFYDLLGAIERRLTETGELEWANRLRDAVAGGATSGEILDRVGVELGRLKSTAIPASSGVASDLLIADQFIDEALGTK